MFTKKIVATFFIAVAFGVGCGSDSKKNDEAKTTLTIAHYLAASSELAALQVIIDAFKVNHPDVNIVTKQIPMPPAQSGLVLMGLENPKCATCIPIEKGGWDIAIQTHNTWAMNSDFKNQLLDLSGEEKLATVKDKFLPKVQANMMPETKWLGMPIGIARFNTATYNLAALASLGFDTPPSDMGARSKIAQAD
ncbi:MAG: hypothetical protein JW841_01780 [Deltaproteobacteria bacterium]|nr:hypothetical protein [Deltaproteobacteria bacterium]